MFQSCSDTGGPCQYCFDLGHNDVVVHYFIFNNMFLYLYLRFDFVLVCCNLKFLYQSSVYPDL